MTADALFAEAEAALRANRVAEARALFGRAGAAGRHDEDAGHAGLPVTKGEKIIASRWLRARPFELK